jgi:hypothetical protein
MEKGSSLQITCLFCELPKLFYKISSCGRNIGASSIIKTSFINYKQSFPTNDSQYFAIKIGLKILHCSNDSNTKMMVTTKQFSTPLTQWIKTA